MTPEEQNEVLTALLSTVQSSPELRAKLVGVAELGNNNRAYYNEKTATDILPVVDAMLEEQKNGVFDDRLFPYETFEENNGWTKSTLFSYVQHGIDWLKDHYNPHKDGRYRTFRDSVSITRRKDDLGVRIIWKDFIKTKSKPGGLFAGVIKVTNDGNVNNNAWKADLMRWMSDPDSAPVFKREGLALTPEDRAWVNTTLKEAPTEYFIVANDGSNLKLGRKQ